MLGKHPKNMTDNELLNLYDTYNSGIVMHEHQIDKAQILIKEMIKRNLAHREPFFGKDEWTEIMNHIKPVKISDKPFAACDHCNRGGEWIVWKTGEKNKIIEKERTVCSVCVESYGWKIHSTDNIPYPIKGAKN